jgi:hypothetical protein
MSRGQQKRGSQTCRIKFKYKVQAVMVSALVVKEGVGRIQPLLEAKREVVQIEEKTNPTTFEIS